MLAIIIAISSLVLPSLDAGPARWDEAQRTISMATVEARAGAMRDGRPVHLVAHVGEFGVELRTGREAVVGPNSDTGEPRALVLGEALGMLPDGAKVDQASGEGEGAAPQPASSPTSRASDITLLTILPGGQVSLAPGWQLILGDRRATPSVNSWTGEVSFTEIVAKTEPGAKDPTDTQDAGEKASREENPSDRATEPSKPAPTAPPAKAAKPASLSQPASGTLQKAKGGL